MSAETKLNIIVSIGSTSLSSSVEVIVTVAEVDPAGITIGEAVAVYSPADAVPVKVNGIVISNSPAAAVVAVRVAEPLVFSTKVAADKANVIEEASSLSVIETVTAPCELVAFTAVPGVTIIVSFASLIVSSIEVNVIVPVVSPANICISGVNW